MLLPTPTGYSGIEVDMVSLGDADCMVVTYWASSLRRRVLIDGGSGKDAEVIGEFLRKQGLTDFEAVICTHTHNDHAAGLIKLLGDKSLTFRSGWMHDMRKHLSPEDLKKAYAAEEGVRQVVENTKELASAFAARGITPQEPFAGAQIGFPIHVLGPSKQFYEKMICESTRVETPALPLPPIPYFSGNSGAFGGLAGLSGKGPGVLGAVPGLGAQSPWYAAASALGGTLTPPSAFTAAPLFAGALSKSSVQENPKTQPFNNTSTILGINYNGSKLLFTGDAGTDALGQIPQEWTHLTWMQVPHHGSDGNLSQENIERLCPTYAYVSAKGDTDHPSQAIVNGS